MLAGACASPPSTSHPAPRANVVLITLDTVRADRLGAYGYAGARTPNLDRLAQEGTRFERAIAVAPITLPTHASIMTGHYPQRHGVRSNGAFSLRDDAHTLAEAFQSAGYDTAAVVSAAVLDRKFGLAQGFRIYRDSFEPEPTPKPFMFPERRAVGSVALAMDLINAELKPPYFLWLHLFDAHADYEPPPPFDRVTTHPYDGEIAYIDHALGRLFAHVRANIEQTPTYVWVSGDHGESLGQHGESTHGIFLYRATTHIPMLVWGPEIRAQELNTLVSQVDIAPTLRQLTGLAPMPTDGVSWATSLRSEPKPGSRVGVFVESMAPRIHFGWSPLRAIDTGGMKLIDAPRREVYDLMADPSEETNLATTQGAIGSMETLGRALHAHMSRDTFAAHRMVPVDHDTQQMLEALGYESTVVPTATLDDPKDRIEQWTTLQTCRHHFTAGNLAEAESCTRELARAARKNPTVQLSWGNLLTHLGRYDEAIEVLKKTHQQQPQRGDVMIALARALHANKQNSKTLHWLQKAARLEPRDAVPWFWMGETHAAAGAFDAAVSAYREALTRNAHDTQSRLGAAESYVELKQTNTAREQLRQVESQESRNPNVWKTIGILRERLGDPPEAVRAYRKTLEFNPRDGHALNNLGHLLSSLGQTREAVTTLERAIDSTPNDAVAHYNLAALIESEDPQRATLLLQRALSIDARLTAAADLLRKIESRFKPAVGSASKGTPTPVP